MATDDDYEVVDRLDIARHIVSEKKPDIPKIKSWLRPTDYNASSSEYQRHLSSQAPGTGEWIRETSQFSQWHSSNDHGSIWIKAVPGAGKSVVAALMVDSLARNESVPVLFFFFRQIIETNRTSRSLLRDWLNQLLPFSEILQVSLWEVVEAKTELETVSTHHLWKLLLSALSSVDRAYCIVDALDEMNIDEEFLSHMNSLGSFRPAHVKVLMTSRPKQYLQRALKDPQVIHVSLEEELVKRDISVFVRQRSTNFGHDGLDNDTQKFIEETVCLRSQGLFLYARLMLDQIEQEIKTKSPSPASIREMITKLPVGLEEMYNRVLFDHAISTGTSQGIQLLILQLVTHSARPMRLVEIAKALEFRRHGTMAGKDSKDIVRNACGPLLEIMEDEVVQILHHSFTEFLLDTSRADRSTIEAPQFPVIDPSVAHHDIAILCLAYVQNIEFTKYAKHVDAEPFRRGSTRRTPKLSVDSVSLSLHYPLMEYATQKWPYHARQYPTNDSAFFAAMEEFCTPDNFNFKAWTELVRKGSSSGIDRGGTRLHVAAGFGLTRWAAHLIEEGANVDALDATENSALFLAAKGGHSEVAAVILKAGANPDIDGYDGLKPLHVAASRNHAEVVKLLLEAGVPPNTPKPREVGRWCGNAPTSVGHHPLMFASQAGHVETVLEMIPFAKPEDLEDSLCWAASGGHFQLLSALLEHSNVSPDAVSKIRHESIDRTSGGKTALMCAVKALSPECVRALTERGADVRKVPVKIPDPGSSKLPRGFPVIFGPKVTAGRTALHSLAGANLDSKNLDSAKEIMNMLLRAGADMEARDESGNTPLLLIVSRWSGKETLALDLFLSGGADPCVTDSRGETLLHRVCSSAGPNLAKQLLSRGANPGQARSSDGSTPLHCAVKNISYAVDHINLLAEHGADINAQDFKGDTPLHVSCGDYSSSRTAAVTDTMLHLGANVNIQNKEGRTCLQQFMYRSSLEKEARQCVESIINSGANLELCDHIGTTALLDAVTRNSEMVDILLQRSSNKASLLARTLTAGKTALHLACGASGNKSQLVKKLVRYGADPQWTDNDGNTLLHEAAASFQGFPEEIKLVKTLVELGVPTHARNTRQRTAAHVVGPIYLSDNSSRTNETRETFVSVISGLDPGFDVNAQDIDGYTPLHFASASSEPETFNLIRAGANLNAKALNGRTPLHCAARGRQSGIIAMIIHFLKESKQDIDVDVADEDGRTPLHDACRSGLPESVRILVDAGANVEREDNSRNTPLMVCAESVEEEKIWSVLRDDSINPPYHDDFRPAARTTGRKQSYRPTNSKQHDTARIGSVAKILIQSGASLDCGISSALSKRNTELLAAIRQASTFLFKDGRSFEETRMMYSIAHASSILDTCNGKFGPVEEPGRFIDDMDEITMDALIARGADFTKKGRTSEDTPIATIARAGLTEYMRKIISKAKLFDDPSFTNPIADSIHCGHNVVRPLLQVACAEATSRMEMIKLLVAEGGVDVNARHQIKEKKDFMETGNVIRGNTALHVLARGDSWWHLDAIKYLVDNGAEVDALDETGRTPLEVSSTFREYGSRQREGFFKPQCCELLLKLGANPNKINPDGLTALNAAKADTDIIKVLLKYGADVNAGSKGVLMSAVEAGDVETLQFYLENGADCNTPDTSSDKSYRSGFHYSLPYRYPLLIAAFPPAYDKWEKSTSPRMVKLLLDHGARVDVPVSDDETLIHYIFEHARALTLRSFIETPGIDMNVKDQRGRTVFLAACSSKLTHESGSRYVSYDERKRMEAKYVRAHVLLADSKKYGSKIDYLAVDNEGDHIAMYLLGQWRKKVTKERFLRIPGVRDMILRKNNAGYSPLHLALRDRKVATCFIFIKEGGADLLEPDPEGNTALHHLFRAYSMEDVQKCLPLIKIFIELGGSIDSRNNLGGTPLHTFLGSASGGSSYSSYWGVRRLTHMDYFEFFISSGADFRATTGSGETVLHIVARREPEDKRYPFRRDEDEDEPDYNSQLFLKLTELGCDPLQEDNDGRTALDIAAATGNKAILDLYQRKKDT